MNAKVRGLHGKGGEYPVLLHNGDNSYLFVQPSQRVKRSVLEIEMTVTVAQAAS
jgi:hypothetical protein